MTETSVLAKRISGAAVLPDFRPGAASTVATSRVVWRALFKEQARA